LLAKTPTDAQIRARVYGKLFPGTPLADPNALSYIGATANNIAGTPQAAKAFDAEMQPERQRLADLKAQMAQSGQQGQQQISQMQQQLAQTKAANQQQLSGMQKSFATAWQQEYDQAVVKGAKAVRDAGLRAARQLKGPVGERSQRLIESANLTGGPQAAAAAATHFWTKMTPEEFVKELAQDQPLLGRSQAGAYVGRQSFGFWLKHMASDPTVWPWIAGMGGIQMLMTGRPSWYLEMAGVGTPLLFRRVISNAFVKGLKDPAAARALLSSSKAARLGIMSPLASTVFKAAIEDLGSRLAQRATGITMEPDDDEGTEAASDEASP
jgi:hypothetical protein